MTDSERDALLIEIHTLQKIANERLNDHGTRLRSLERARMIATGVLMSCGLGAAMARDVALEWIKNKISTGSHG